MPLRAKDMLLILQADLFQHLTHGTIKMNHTNFSHLVEFNNDDNEVIIYRVFPDGGKQLFTKTKLPTDNLGENKSVFESFARTLGENILIDSPVARARFNI